jgi:hypothetical protein
MGSEPALERVSRSPERSEGEGVTGILSIWLSGSTKAQKDLCKTLGDPLEEFHWRVRSMIRRVTRWLVAMGLRLHADKTRMTHTLTPYRGLVGFDFLGFTFRHYPVDQSGRGGLPGFKTSITPSEKAINRHMAAIGQLLPQLRTASQAQGIRELDLIIGGWAAYYAECVPAAILSHCDNLMEACFCAGPASAIPTRKNSGSSPVTGIAAGSTVGSFPPPKASNCAHTVPRTTSTRLGAYINSFLF